MKSQLLSAVIASVVRYEPAGFDTLLGPDCSTVAVSVVGGQKSSWRIRVYADLGGVMVHVGSVRTLPGGGGARLVAVATCPGAKAWEVRGEKLATPAWGTGDTQTTLEVRMSAAPDGGAPGVQTVAGLSEPSENRSYLAGVSGTVVAPGGVRGWSAYNSTAVDGSVAIDGGASILVPAGGFVAGGDLPETPWGHQFAFVGTTSYLVESATGSPGAGA